jgi:hypothetical protein
VQRGQSRVAPPSDELDRGASDDRCLPVGPNGAGEFPIIEDIYRELLPTKAPASSLFFGKVVTLSGQPGDDGTMQGETTLALLHDEEILKARADLGPDDYQKAVDAHRNDEPVKLWGVLHLGRRIHRLADITGFSALER